MKIAFYLSDMGGSPLMVGLSRGLERLGHTPEQYRPGGGYDLVLIFNQSAHTHHYAYPPFPNGGCPIVFIDNSEYGYFKRLPGVRDDYLNTFSPGAMNHDTKNKFQQQRLKDYLDGKSFPYFLREYFKDHDWPESYHPIDYPLYAFSTCEKRPSLDEYVARQNDLFVFWGGSHPWRHNITAALRECPVNSDINLIDDITNPRRPQREYFLKTEAAKASVSFDGYGASSFRLTEVLVRTVLLRGPLTIKLRDDLTDGVNCVEYGVESDGETFLSTNVNEKLLGALADPEAAYRIYEAGYRHCMEYWTEEATARYLLGKVMAHDYSKPTPLDLQGICYNLA